MQVALASMFRDSMSYLDRYFTQVENLRQVLEHSGHQLRIICVENDSEDGTFRQLDEWAFGHFVDVTILRVTDDCPYFPSVDEPDRWRHIAWVCNHALKELEPADDVLIYVESDLIWQPYTMVKLIENLEHVPACSAKVFAGDTERYYDTWGHRAEGRAFLPWPPYHDGLLRTKQNLFRMDSASSVLAVRAELAAQTRFQPEDAFIGWCRDIVEKGGSIWLDPDLCVRHPQ